MANASLEFNDREGYNKVYKGKSGTFADATTASEYQQFFVERIGTPFHLGSWVFDGAVMQQAITPIHQHCAALGRPRSQITILDVGSGKGELSVYLAIEGYNVIGIDVSEQGNQVAGELAKYYGLGNNIRFVTGSAGDTNLPAQSVDVIVGRNSLHHFIKYPDVPAEFRRITTSNAFGIFTDSFGENIFKNLFHDKKLMAELGDELLRKPSAEAFFEPESVAFTPTNWFSQPDKLLIRTLGWKRRDRRGHRFGTVLWQTSPAVGQDLDCHNE